MSRYDDYVAKREERKAISSGEVVVKSILPTSQMTTFCRAISLSSFEEQTHKLKKKVATKTYNPQIKILVRNARIKISAVKFTAESVIKDEKAVSFQNLNLGVVRFSGKRMPLKRTTPKLRFWLETLTLRFLQ